MAFVRLKSIVLLSATALVALNGCRLAPEGLPTDGTFTPGSYTNSFFAFSIAFPRNWSESAQAVAEKSRRERAEAPAIARTNDLFRQQLAAENPSHHLLVISEHPWGSAAPSNPSLIIAAEEIADDPRIRSGKDYLVKVSRLLANSPLPYQPVGELREVRMGGVSLGRLDLTANIAGHSLHQTHLAQVQHGYALTFILSASNEAELKRLETFLDSLKFE
jgi:hypothetical protein